MKSVRLMIWARSLFWIGIIAVIVVSVLILNIPSPFFLIFYLVGIALIFISICLKEKANRITGE